MQFFLKKCFAVTNVKLLQKTVIKRHLIVCREKKPSCTVSRVNSSVVL